MIRFLLNRITTLFFLFLAIGVGGAMAVQMFYVAPKKSCEKQGHYWIDGGKGVPHGFANTCATPINVRNMPKMPDLPTVAAPGKS